ncbi:uncharacterized protein LOC111718399 isoform X1 [Eurytemora carolleeae]|uniref:uncharacterized protein LOC111718399 isoform X1 n=1 Tax=Eurytemora carolleeae TaxID=1294199 RepID=UPI000C7576E1|nr:uncharacterized protein LOC111718399 isoform X1 [Eurytemora carolleeae]|eukprot:XP_023349745.1 uncharacterized protein LOC111718399 isoform X1 [Eurytemora affinis]
MYQESTGEVLSDSPVYSANPSTPISYITGAPSIFTTSGDNVQLECRISGLKNPPLSLYWTKDGTVLTPRIRSGISLEVEKLPGVSHSTLFMGQATPADSGEYACMSDVSPPAVVSLFVSEGSEQSPLLASLSSSGDSFSCSLNTLFHFSTYLFVFLFIYPSSHLSIYR